MNTAQSKQFRTLSHITRSGLNMGLVTALFYGLAFSLVAIPRASAQILATLSLEEGMLATLFANAANIYILAIEFAFGLGLIAAVFCAISFLLVYGMVLILHANTPRQRMWIGLATSLVLAVILHALLWPIEGIAHAMLFRSIGGYLFWLGAPCLIYIALTGWMSLKSFPVQKGHSQKHLHSRG